jgi:hypothetical protein
MKRIIAGAAVLLAAAFGASPLAAQGTAIARAC